MASVLNNRDSNVPPSRGKNKPTGSWLSAWKLLEHIRCSAACADLLDALFNRKKHGHISCVSVTSYGVRSHKSNEHRSQPTRYTVALSSRTCPAVRLLFFLKDWRTKDLKYSKTNQEKP